MKTINNELNIGASSPFRIIHITDTHLTYADERDCERKCRLSQGRAKIFPFAEEILALASQTAKQLGATIMHTGDLIDFVSVANLERAKRFIDENDCFFAAGNHEFSQFVGEATEDAAYRNQSLATVQKVFSNDIRMSSRVINGVNFVALDDGYYLFEPEQLDFLRTEVQKGLPIVLLLHNPLYEESFYEDLMYHREKIGLPPAKDPCLALTGVPEERMQHYDAYRFQQQRPDKTTLETIAYIKAEPLFKAVLAGHVHFNYEGKLKEGVPQLITSLTDMRVITVK